MHKRVRQSYDYFVFAFRRSRNRGSQESPRPHAARSDPCISIWNQAHFHHCSPTRTCTNSASDQRLVDLETLFFWAPALRSASPKDTTVVALRRSSPPHLSHKLRHRTHRKPLFGRPQSLKESFLDDLTCIFCWTTSTVTQYWVLRKPCHYR